jgi:GT2 family glycosyltransferase
MKISVVIVTWNVREYLLRCLQTVLREAGGYDLDVIVIDNASNDGTVEAVGSEYPGVKTIQNRENAGFARANNQGIRICQGEYVLLLNPDTELLPGALDRMADYLNAHPQAGGAGPRVLNADGSLQPSCSPLPSLARETARLLQLPGVRTDGYYEMASWDLQTPRQVDVLLGACMLLRGSTLAALGGLDEDYYIYTEEVDLCYRLKKAGWSLAWVPAAQIVHYRGQSTQQVAADMFMRLYQSKLLFFRKHHG